MNINELKEYLLQEYPDCNVNNISDDIQFDAQFPLIQKGQFAWIMVTDFIDGSMTVTWEIGSKKTLSVMSPDTIKSMTDRLFRQRLEKSQTTKTIGNLLYGLDNNEQVINLMKYLNAPLGSITERNCMDEFHRNGTQVAYCPLDQQSMNLAMKELLGGKKTSKKTSKKSNKKGFGWVTVLSMT